MRNANASAAALPLKPLLETRDLGCLPTTDLFATKREVCIVGTEFWEGDATKQKSVKKSAVSLNGVRAFSE